MLGAIWLPIGLFIYSFTQYQFLTWVGPMIALAPIAIGIFFIFESCYSSTSDCYGENLKWPGFEGEVEVGDLTVGLRVVYGCIIDLLIDH